MKSEKQLWKTSGFWKIILGVCAMLSVSGAGASAIIAQRSINAVTQAPTAKLPIAQYIAPAVQPDPQEITVYVTNTGSKYHRDGCQYLRQSRIPISLKDARRSYSACSVCHPPQ